MNQIEIYKGKDNQTEVEVRFEEDTVWLTQKQMSELFQTKPQNITMHLGNIFADGELEESATCKNYLQVQMEGNRKVKRKPLFYNLDAILSVGYRINSKRGTQFRIWATQVLRKHLVDGYTINERRLKEQTQQKFLELQRTVKMIQTVAGQRKLSSDEATGLLNIIADYTLALDVLDKYDNEQLTISGTKKKEKFRIDYSRAAKAIDALQKKFKSSSLFGKEKDESFKSSLNTIYQTFGKKDLYPGIEEKAAHLLYFVVKNHSFVDGNKRIAAFLFVWFMERNGLLYRKDGTKRIADNALVALTLLIAQSKPEEKDMMVKVVVNLINKNN